MAGSVQSLRGLLGKKFVITLRVFIGYYWLRGLELNSAFHTPSDSFCRFHHRLDATHPARGVRERLQAAVLL